MSDHGEDGALALILGGPKDESSDDSKEQPVSHELVMAAEELVKAIHSREASRVAQAFDAMFKVCELGPHDESKEDSSDDRDILGM